MDTIDQIMFLMDNRILMDTPM